jgi:hypothetical protein
MVATVITLVSKTRSERGAEALRPPSASGLVQSALEPSGAGPYVDAVREWIERVTPRPAQRPELRLVGAPPG